MTQTTVNNNKRAAKYLQLFRPNGYINLVAIHPLSGETTGITRDSKSPDLLTFIEKYNGNWNLYYMVNEPYEDAPDKKLTKEHVAKVHALFIDADPDKEKDFNEERDRLSSFVNELNKSPSFDFKPTFTVDSGGGYQAFWLLNKPFDAEEHDDLTVAENYGRGLSTKFKTDRVHNIDRIMRLPFTYNLPTEKKKLLGRTTQLATVTHATQKRYNWETLSKICEPEEAPSYENSTQYDDLNMDLLSKKDVQEKIKQKFKNELNNSAKLQAICNKDIKKPSRSEYDFLLAQQLKMSGWTLQETAEAMYLFPHGKNKELTAREISRAYNRASNPIEGLSIPNAEEIMKNNPLLLNAPKTDEDGFKLPKRLKMIHNSGMEWKNFGKPLVKGLIDQQSMVVMYGPSNVGKSFVALDIAMHVAIGKNWGEHKVPEKKAVIYIFAEAGASAGKRVLAAKKRLNIPDIVPKKECPFYSITMGINLLEKPTKDRNDVEDVILLAQQAKRETGYDVGLVVVDTLSTAFSGGNENSSEDMGTIISNFKQVQELAHTTILPVHHCGKDQAAGARGHSSLRAATDTELEVKSELQGTRYHRELIVKKQRDGETGNKIKFGLNVVDLGIDDQSDPITSCNVVLEGDSEFESIMPSLVDALNEEHKRLYYSIYLAEKTGTGHQSLVNAWLDYLIKQKTPLEQKDIDILVKEKPITVGIKNEEVSTKRNNLTNWRNALVGKGIVESKALSTKPGDIIWKIV